MIIIDSKTLRLLEYLAGAPCRSYDELERFYGALLDVSLEFQRLFVDSLAFDATNLFQPPDGITRISITPHGREIIEAAHRERQRDIVTHATFLIVALTFLLKLLGYF